jgi:integrase
MSDAVRAILSGERRDKRWVFPHRWGGGLAYFPSKLWYRVTKAAKLTGGPHQLRHTFASHFLAAVPDMFLLAKVLGQSHTRITEIYAHLLPGQLDRARNAVNLAPTLAPALAAPGRKRKKQA